MKIALLGNQARAMSNFWTVLIRVLQKKGHEVICLVPKSSSADALMWESQLTLEGARVVYYSLERKGLNPFADLKTLWTISRVFLSERPDLLFAFTIKPVIYGSFAAALARVPHRANRFLMITGLGYMFEADSPLKRVLRRVACLLYKAAFRCANVVFFQNNDDRDLFTALNILPSSVTVCMSKGTGVDLEYFAAQPFENKVPTFLFIGRLLEAKGLKEFAEAARIVKKDFPDAIIQILGPEEQGPGSLPLHTVLSWQKEGIIQYLGSTRDVRPYLAKASVVVLPSWREGTPTSLLEAMSMGRAIIAADVPGSREVVSNNSNGLLVPVKNSDALAKAMKRLIVDPELTQTMGRAGRLMAEATFSAEQVACSIAKIMGA